MICFGGKGGNYIRFALMNMAGHARNVGSYTFVSTVNTRSGLPLELVSLGKLSELYC